MTPEETDLAIEAWDRLDNHDIPSEIATRATNRIVGAYPYEKVSDVMGDIYGIIQEECAASPPLPSREAWQPIETAPKNGTPIFVAVYTQTYGWVRGTAYWSNAKGISGWISRGISDPPGELGLAHPSHWQPLPPSPRLHDDILAE